MYRPWIVTTGVVVASLGIAKTLRELGANQSFGDWDIQGDWFH